VQLRDTGELRYTRAEEGELVSYQTRSLAALGTGRCRRPRRVPAGRRLQPQERAHRLRPDPRCQPDRPLYDPRAFLDDVHQRLLVGGILMPSSPYTWLEEQHGTRQLVGGFKQDGENRTMLDALKELLAPHFRMLGAPRDVPFVIRETRRKHQHTVAEVTLWERIA
jgi:hypothetical protein